MQRSSGLGRIVIALLCAATVSTVAEAAHAANAGDTILTSGVAVPAGKFPSSGSGNDGSGEPSTSSVSGNGRYVAFVSDEDDLAPGANPDTTNVFRKDRTTGAVELISRTTGAGGTGLPALVAAPVISNDGNRVAWTSDAAFDPADADTKYDVFVRDVAAGTTTLATPGTATDIYDFDLSGDGNWVAFATTEALAGPADANGVGDIYRRNLGTGVVTLASAVNALTTAGNASAYDPAISDDGAWVAFASAATNLFAGYTNGGGGSDVFARRLATNATVLISAKYNSLSTGGNGASSRPVIAGQPNLGASLRVGYASDATNLADNAVTDTSSADSGYVRQFSVNASTLVSRATGFGGANADSRAHFGGISDDGQRVVFMSDATNLTTPTPDSYYGSYTRDLSTGVTTLLSAKNGYAVWCALSADGTYATWYESGATADADPNLPGVFGRTFPNGPIELVSRPAGSAPLVAAAPETRTPNAGARTVSGDGRYVVFSAGGAGLGNGRSEQIYRRDLRTNELELVSRATGADGAVASRFAYEPTIDASGTRITFITGASLDPADTNDAFDIYLRDLQAHTTTLISRASGADGAVSNGQVSDGSISADGTRVAFRSASTNFGVADGKGHVYVRDVGAATTELADRADGPAGVISNQGAESPQLSADGRRVVFESDSTNLSPDDPAAFTNDIYLRDLTTGSTTLLSRRSGLAGAKVTGAARYPAFSSDGTTVAFTTNDQLAATEAGPWGGNTQVVARKVATGENALVSRTAGGAVGNRDASSPSLSADGNVIGFSTDATNLLPGVGGSNRDAVIARNMATGALSGPPAFGLALDFAQQRATYPSISEDGQCMAFSAVGHNAITGQAGDFQSAYLYVISGNCPKPVPATPVPAPTPGITPGPLAAALSKVSLTNKRFKVGAGSTALTATASSAAPKKKTPTGTTFTFTLNTKATVRITILRRVGGRKLGKQCLKATPKRAKLRRCKRYEQVGKLTRTAVPAGAQKVAFSGRLGKKKLPVGAYQAVLVGSTSAGSSKPVTLSFNVVAR